CLGCTQRETTIHLFFKCSHVNRLWRWTTERWRAITGMHVTITEEKIISGFPFGSRQSKKSDKAIIWANLCMDVLWAIWSERNRCAFNGGQFSYYSLLQVLKFNLSDTLKALQSKYPLLS